MRWRELAVSGAFAFTPDVFPDERGSFVSPLQQETFLRTAGLPCFPVAQASHSRSRRGVVRGVHYTHTPPGCAKYVHCPHGRALDIVVDVRTGSPTFGRWDEVLLDAEQARAVYLPIGVGHAFVALADDTIVSYLLSIAYNPTLEAAVSVCDPALDLPIPTSRDRLLSERDSSAPTLAEAEAAGLLPRFTTCAALTSSLGPAGIRA
jgi:epimerase EvaD